MDAIYFVMLEGNAEGPFTLDQIRAMYRERTIDGCTPFAKEDLEWQPLENSMETLFQKRSEHDATPMVSAKSKGTRRNLAAFGLLLIWLLAVFASVRYSLLPKFQRPPNDYDAYVAARHYVTNEIAGAREISPFEQSRIVKATNEFLVTFRVRGLNAFGGPVQNYLRVHVRPYESGLLGCYADEVEGLWE